MWSFLIPFGIALITMFMAYHSQEEIVKTFLVLILSISLLVSFAWAPWFIQLLILVGSLTGMRYFCDRHSCQNAVKNRFGGY